MTVALGIDAGGTYTDAVLVDQASGAVLASAKALTTHYDLSIGIRKSIAAVFERAAGLSPGDVDLVGLSTTLATNAIVEGRGSPICLLLIGYDPALIEKYGFEQALVTQNVVYIAGGHDGAGDEARPLDEAAAREAILAYRDRVGAFAISGYFAVRNPAHELRVRALVEELTSQGGRPPLPVTCGHELTTRLNAVRRATTVALNARLIPLLRELIASVGRTLEQLGVTAPLMVVKGDGSLVRASWAMGRPIETILSGPAASVVGACHLGSCGEAWVIDVGGTTTDIAALSGARPSLNPEGAQVGPWRTMVEAVDAHTVGLGGDSLVRLEADGRLAIGPRRVVPLCMLADKHPTVVEELRRQLADEAPPSLAGQFVLTQRRGQGLSEDDRALWCQIEAGPQSLVSLLDQMRYGWLMVRRIEGLESRQVLLRAGFTPTDALHVLGRFVLWSTDAARLGAQLLADRLGLSPEAFCQQVVEGLSDRVSRALVSKVLGDEEGLPRWEEEPTAAALLARALGKVPQSNLACRLRLQRPVVAIGAPVEAYMPRVAQQLQTDLVIPEHAGVANAVGAVAGGVALQQRVLIQPLDGDKQYRLHLPDRVADLSSVEEAVAYAREVVPARLAGQARAAGADQVEVQMTRVDQQAPVRGGWGDQIYLGTELTFRAVGRPSPAREGA